MTRENIPPARLRFSKTATIFKSEKFICIETLSGTAGLTYHEDEPYRIYLELDATDEVLGRVLLSALDRSRYIEDDEFYEPGRATRVYAEWEKEFTRHHGYKSKRTAFKNVDWCMTKIREGNIVIQPHRRHSPGSWRSLPPEMTVVIPDTRDEATVGAALRLALDRCE
jgi:contact-dependent growth inhibition (CDI) system CdiI-like immunity protein